MRHSLTQILATSIAAVIIVGCADQRSLETGLMPGEIHAGPPVEFVDAPVGTTIIATDGTKLERTYANWVVSTSAGTVRAFNAFWWDDPRPLSNSVQSAESVAETLGKVQKFNVLTPGFSVSLRENGYNTQYGAEGTWTVLGAERITVPAGEFDAVKIRRYDASSCGQCGNGALRIVQNYWFVPGTGVVKYSGDVLAGMAAGAHAEWAAAKITRG